MEFGLFSNNRRPDRIIGDAWNEDIYEAEVADRLGFNEIWFSEHQSPAELIICKAAGRTERIRLGSAVRPLGYYHPLQVALEANTTDQLTGGRYMLGADSDSDRPAQQAARERLRARRRKCDRPSAIIP